MGRYRGPNVEPVTKRRRTAVALLAPLLLSACGEGAELGLQNDTSPPPPAAVESQARIREDFINEQLVERTSGVSFDVNRGLVSLPTRVFPAIGGDRLRSYATSTEENGVVAAEQILIEEAGVVRASDSIELAARDFLRVTGEIHAGLGGVTLAAGRRLLIDGTVSSQGPIRILVVEEDGTIEIAGRVVATGSLDGSSPGIELAGRGRVILTGVVATSAPPGATSGDITADTYGKLSIGGFARVGTGAPGGRAGSIRLKSESEIELFGGAWVGSEERTYDPALRDGRVPGEISLEAEHINLGADSNIVGGSAPDGAGGSIMIAAGTELTMDGTARIAAGGGLEGGRVSIGARSAQFGEGSEVTGGLGIATAGTARIETAGPLTIGPRARLSGGEGACTAGGALSLSTGGVLTLDYGAYVRGGSGGGRAGMWEGCPQRLHKGGDVEVVARAIDGVLESAISGGEGPTPGVVRVTIDPAYVVAPPNLTVATRGWILSRSIDRGASGVGQLPSLRDLVVELPAGTAAVLELGGTRDAAGEITTWVELPGQARELEALRDARYFRYRVVLSGRAFDTPVVDYFDIDLAPSSGGR